MNTDKLPIPSLPDSRTGNNLANLPLTKRLRDTGDIAPIGGTGLDQALQEESYGGGENRSMVMVAENLVRLSKTAWSESRGRLAETHE
jgi:hypothetical protein